MSCDQKQDGHRARVGCCGEEAAETGDAGAVQGKSPLISGSVTTDIGEIPRVSRTLGFKDRLGGWRARWNIDRMSYIVAPGLYAVGEPDRESPVFVSANYKLSFDHLRSYLKGIDGWILVLDTRGINVWCAAGKGTFGTDELVKRVSETGLGEIVSHRKLIVPQLGAPGVSAHLVRRETGFRVIFGPVRALDLPGFIRNGYRATPEMREVRFPLPDRLVLIPVEIVGGGRYALMTAAAMLILSGLSREGFSLAGLASTGLTSVLLLLCAVMAGAVLVPILLPWLPGRPFAVKGAWVGALGVMGVWWLSRVDAELFGNWAVFTSWLLLIPAITSFVGMNFTGSSTYTSLSGVLKEMRIALPLQIGFALVGAGLWITGLFI
jgi:hypothetical protein